MKGVEVVTGIRNQNGFSLIELNATVVIIAVLVAIAIPVYALAQDHIRRTADEANLRVIIEATGRWIAEDLDSHKPELLTTQELREELEGHHIEAWPVSPTGREYIWAEGRWFIAEFED